MKVKEESEKVSLKLNIQKTKIMASWQTDGEIVTDFIFGGSKITADGDWEGAKSSGIRELNMLITMLFTRLHMRSKVGRE